MRLLITMDVSWWRKTGGGQMDEATFQKNYTMQSVHKVGVILRAFSEEEPRLTLTKLHKKTGIGISSLQRFLSTLVYEGFLYRDEQTKQYELGLSMLFLGRLVDKQSSFLQIVKPILKELNQFSGESVSYNILDGYERRCVLNFESVYLNSHKSSVGDTAPLYIGATSKSILAFLPEEEREVYLAQVVIEPRTKQTVKSVDELRAQLDQVRENGYAVSYGERVAHTCSISAPIRLVDRPIGSVTLAVPTDRFHQYDEQKLAKHLMIAAQKIEQKIHS